MSERSFVHISIWVHLSRRDESPIDKEFEIIPSPSFRAPPVPESAQCSLDAHRITRVQVERAVLGHFSNNPPGLGGRGLEPLVHAEAAMRPLEIARC